MEENWLNVLLHGRHDGFYVGDVDEFDKPVERTKQQYPYSYSGFVQWRGGKNEEADGTIYSDRLLQWDYKKHNDLCKKHFGNQRQYWTQREPKKIESFLRDWTKNDKLKLILVMEYCNASNGYPLWRFDFST